LKAFELKNLSDQELRKRIIDEEENLSHLKFQLQTSQLESPIKVRLVRREIARMRTILRRRELDRTKEMKNPIT